MKKILLISMMLSIAILSGCGTDTQEIVFDNFVLPIAYEGSGFVTTNPPDALNNHTLYQSYIQTTDNTGFINSILIAQYALISGATLETFVEANHGNVIPAVAGYQVGDTDNIHIRCDDGQYTGLLHSFIDTSTLDNEEILYFDQYYLQQDKQIYIISTASAKEKQHDRFVKGIKNITCKEE